MNRIYHPYWAWECFKSGFYESNNGDYERKVINLFSSKQKTEKYMMKVLEWEKSCEHNLTNPSLNKVAWIGQCACFLYAKVPANYTMKYWWSVDKKFRDQADMIAKSVILYWESNNKNIQLCLNII